MIVVTLYHWDLPLDIEKKYGGWLGEKIPHLFAKYCERCFALFGDRVKMWITLNEPWCSAVMGYCTGDHAPGIDDAPGMFFFFSFSFSFFLFLFFFFSFSLFLFFSSLFRIEYAFSDFQ